MRSNALPAAVLIAGCVLVSALTYSHSFAEGLAYTLILGGIPCIVLFVVIFAAMYIVRQLIGRWLPDWLPLAAAVLLAVMMVGYGVWESRSSTRYATHVLKPVPAGVQDLRVRKLSTFGDGHGWYFAFTAPPEVFTAAASKHGLREMTAAEHAAMAKEFSPGGEAPQIPAEQPFNDLNFAEPGFYTRPDNARFFKGNRAAAVVSGDCRVVYLFRDYYRYPRGGDSSAPASSTGARK